MLNTILFDLDGTLLPMDQEYFVKGYMKEISTHFASQGLEPEKLIKSIWAGVAEAVQNDGKRTNEEVFWECFANQLGEQVLDKRPEFDSFYENKFGDIIYTTNPTENAKKAVHALKKKGYKLVLATNPVFPKAATYHRIGWAGLSPDDFSLITSYENSVYSKPNLKYYEDIMEKVGAVPEKSMMVGNDVEEDMVAAKTGMKTFLITDCLISRNGTDISSMNTGSFEEFLEYAEKLPDACV